MKNLFTLSAVLSLSLASIDARAQQSASPPTARVAAGFVLEISALSTPDQARPEWSQQLAIAGEGRASARYTNSRATVVDLSVAARQGEADRIVIELDVREERARGAVRSSHQTRQSIAIRRGEAVLVQSVSPDGATRVLRLTVR
jgi:hypothetical protein